jgi:hypothetical protein
MTEDEALLLSGEDWIEIVSVAAEEAALNPGRLFRLDPVNPNDVLAGKLIAVVLRSARATLEAPDRRSRSVLYGQTLREAIVLALEATSGHPEFVREKMGTIENLVDALNKLATDHHERYGSREWLFLFEILLDSLLEGVDLPELTDAAAREFLKGIA